MNRKKLSYGHISHPQNIIFYMSRKIFTGQKIKTKALTLEIGNSENYYSISRFVGIFEIPYLKVYEFF